MNDAVLDVVNDALYEAVEYYNLKVYSLFVVSLMKKTLSVLLYKYSYLVILI